MSPGLSLIAAVPFKFYANTFLACYNLFCIAAGAGLLVRAYRRGARGQAGPRGFLAGHTHGGQVQLPFHGTLIHFEPELRKIARGGMHRMGKLHVCVSRGVGMERALSPRMRFLCPPEIVVIDLCAPDGAK